MKKKMQKKCRFENKLVKPENWTGQEFTFSPTVHRNFFFAISGYFWLEYQKMAEKIKINLSNGQKKVPMSNFCRGLEIGKSACSAFRRPAIKCKL
jgi:hypothetical protein